MSTVIEDPRKLEAFCSNATYKMFGSTSTRSLVAFGPKCRLMGQSAKNQHVLNYKNTVYGFRNLLGRKFSDPYVQQEMKRLPFTIFAQKDDSIGIKVVMPAFHLCGECHDILPGGGANGTKEGRGITN